MIREKGWDGASLVAVALSLAALFLGGHGPWVTAAPLDTANVMAPLYVADDQWGVFEDQLTAAKNYGVDAVSIDVWWGVVQGGSDERPGETPCDWSYYDKLFSTVKRHGLKIVPILSFHQCGGNVGDTCNFPLPAWLWTKYLGKTFRGIQINDTDLQYKSEQGHFSREVVQLWADALVLDEYTNFVKAFREHFSPAYDEDFIEINISAGPAGELRYPSYNAHDTATGYPTRGGLQCYSRLAVQDFREKMLSKYGSLANVSTAWGIQLADATQIQPPSNPEAFFRNGDYKNIPYGKDFVDWYNQSLVDHGKTLIGAVIDTLGNAFPAAKIGYKIPGVHWAMTNPAYPRAAEVAAGLIQTSVDGNADTTGHGYTKIVALAKTLEATGRQMVLHFTCLEMDNEDFPQQYSLAKSLVFWVANEARRQGVAIKGENALSGGITGDHGWDNIDNAFVWASYTGLTTLRIGEVATGTGQARYRDFIQKHRLPRLFAGEQPLSLGVSYRPEATTFTLWSPDTANVQLWLDDRLYPMAPVATGQRSADTYTVTVAGDQHLKRYNFRVAGRVARDPYGVMVDPGTDNNVVLDLTRTEPVGGWAPRPPLKAREDAVIYEVHVRDFTIDDSSGVDPEKRGKFLGMVQPGTTFQGRKTGLDHLKELGITHVQILPFFDFRSCSGEPASCYNWGYDPLNFNVPEERYSLHPDDPVERIRELKTMINEFHKAGIRVIMDVVYNHTAAGGWPETTFSPITPQYFVGRDLSGTGNAVNDRMPMVCRFIRDSLEFWVREYHVDGFRFDLMGVFRYAAVGDWGRTLQQQFPDAMLLIYGEPWRGGGEDPVPEGERARLGTIGRIVDAHVGAFNDQYRIALKGDSDSSAGGGYIFNQPKDLFAIRVGSRGAIRFTYDPTQILPNPRDQMFANDPEQTINYVSAHDNLVLRDKIRLWAGDNHVGNNPKYLQRIQEFANGIILTSQGIPFLHAGDEMLRDKQGNPNSYNASDDVNKIRWQWKIDNPEVFDYHRNLIAMRRAHPGFRMTSWDQINQNIRTEDTLRYGVVVNRINAAANGDGWQEIIVIYNSADNYEYTLPGGIWHVALEKSDSNAGPERPVSDKVAAEGTAVTVLHR